MTSKRASKLSLARSFAEGKVAPVSKSSGLMSAMCLPFGSHSSPLRSLVAKKDERHQRHPTGRRNHVSGEAEEQGDKRKPRARARSSNRSPVDSVLLENDLLWPGNGSTPTSYPGLEKEEDLWLIDGDCLVYFEEAHNKKPPTASFRVSSSAVRRADLAFLNQLIGVGEKRCRPKHFSPSAHQIGHQTLANANPLRLSPPTQSSSRSGVRPDGYLHLPRAGQPLQRPLIDTSGHVPDLFNHTASAADNNRSLYVSGHEAFIAREATQYEIWFAVPGQMNAQETKKHKLALRNLLAIIHNKPIVGSNPLTAISEVQELVTAFSSSSNRQTTGPSHTSPHDSRPPPGTGQVAAYVRDFAFDDIRCNLPQALKLLAWSESPDVQWASGYAETFVHVVGMMSHRTINSHGFAQLSHVTRRNLTDAFNNLRLIVTEAEEQLKSFNFSQMWTSKLGSSGARKTFDALAHFLNDFYMVEYGTWPPVARCGDQRWLNRSLVGRLQNDFGALYDYLVDREVVWKNKLLIHKSQRVFSADETSPLTAILLGFDDYHGLLHIPHPFPLLPTESLGVSPTKMHSQSFLRRSSAASYQLRNDARLGNVFARATNSDSLRHGVEPNKLLRAFQSMECNALLGDVTPQEARIGRWILLYGALQVLSLLSVDITGLRHTVGVDYFLCASLRGCPPWKDGRLPISMTEASQNRSYCWESPESWPKKSALRKDSVTTASPTDDRRPTLSQLHFGSLVSGASWYNSEIAYSPVSEGAARILPIQYGRKGTLLDVHRGGNFA